MVKNDQGQILADLKSNNDEFLIACGGSGGYGNSQLLSDENRTPTETLPPELGEEVLAELELRILADYGIVGLPNSGKSSMIRYLTNATPDVSDVPGTTLVPHLGSIEYRDQVGITIADLPGIEPENVPFYFNTSSRAGRFLQHCARCKSLVYLIDGSKEIPLNSVEQFRIIREHLESYDVNIEREQREIQLSKTEFPTRFHFAETEQSISSVLLTQVPFIVAISKSDERDLSEEIYLLNEELIRFNSHFQNVLYFPKVIKTSAIDLTGWQILCYLLRAMKEDFNNCKTDDLYW